MRNIIEVKSSILSIVMRSIYGLFGSAKDVILEDVVERGFRSKPPVGFWDIFTRWKIIVDIGNKQITVRKRNWYLIGVKEDTYAFKSIRQVTVHNLIFGADLGIKLYSGYALVYSIPKSDAKQIKQILMNPNWNLKDNDVMINIDNEHHDL